MSKTRKVHGVVCRGNACIAKRVESRRKRIGEESSAAFSQSRGRYHRPFVFCPFSTVYASIAISLFLWGAMRRPRIPGQSGRHKGKAICTQSGEQNRSRPAECDNPPNRILFAGAIQFATSLSSRNEQNPQFVSTRFSFFSFPVCPDGMQRLPRFTFHMLRKARHFDFEKLAEHRCADWPRSAVFHRSSISFKTLTLSRPPRTFIFLYDYQLL